MGNPSRGPSWNGHGNGLAATRFQPARTGKLTAADLPRLKLKWAFGYASVGAARAQPAVAGGKLFAASENGEVHALDPATGCTYWTFKALAGVRTAPVAAPYRTASGRTRYAVYFGDGRANSYAVDADTGTADLDAQARRPRLGCHHRQRHRPRGPRVLRRAGPRRGRPRRHQQLSVLHVPRQPERARCLDRCGALEDLHHRSEPSRGRRTRTASRCSAPRAARSGQRLPSMRNAASSTRPPAMPMPIPRRR